MSVAADDSVPSVLAVEEDKAASEVTGNSNDKIIHAAQVS